MKKPILIFLIISLAYFTNAQPRLIGMTQRGGVNDNGTILQYFGGATSVDTEFSLPANASNAGQLNSTLTQAPNGKVYGLNIQSGATSMGTLIEYDYTSNTDTIRFNFDDSSGYYPGGSLLLANNGLMYGLTLQGGANNGGTIFSYALGSNTITKLVDLPSGASPDGSLIQAADGHLYGLSRGDGANHSGTIFRYDIAVDSYRVVYDLRYGASPFGNLLEVGADTLYGVTTKDGQNNNGSLFRYITATGSYTVLDSNTNYSNSSSYLCHASDGNLYGVIGGTFHVNSGNIYRFNLSTNTYTDLYDFGGGTDGANPDGGFIQASDGILYATTNSGGQFGDGTIFKYDISAQQFTKLVDLNNTTGTYPNFGYLIEYTGPLGIQSVNACHFSLSPNPTNGSFTIENNYNSLLSVNIINLLGERLKTFTMIGLQQTFDISDLAAGIYEIQISDVSQTLKVIKVVKE